MLSWKQEAVRSTSGAQNTMVRLCNTLLECVWLYAGREWSRDWDHCWTEAWQCDWHDLLVIGCVVWCHWARAAADNHDTAVRYCTTFHGVIQRHVVVRWCTVYGQCTTVRFYRKNHKFNPPPHCRESIPHLDAYPRRSYWTFLRVLATGYSCF